MEAYRTELSSITTLKLFYWSLSK